ncbi:MAG: hypothetical protein ACLTXT_00250 [Ruminococcus callidus]
MRIFEKLRSEVNQWIRTTTEIDGCVDFDRAVCDGASHGVADGFDSGDHLHPSVRLCQNGAGCRRR